MSLAWEVYGEANGTSTFAAMHDRLVAIRERNRMGDDRRRDFEIGCILINEAVFFDESDWVRMPRDFAENIVGGKSYDLLEGEGERIWRECLARGAQQDGYALIAESDPD